MTTGRAFALSLSYVLGMASTYTAAGIAVAAGGQHVQALFQQTWIIVLFAALFVVLALSMFGLFTLQMPAAHPDAPGSLSNRQTAGTFGGVALMGVLSALIVTTCVAPRSSVPHCSSARAARSCAAASRSVCHEPRDGRAAARRGRLGGQAAAEGRRMDGHGQAAVRRDDAGGRRLDAGRASSRSGCRCCCGPSRLLAAAWVLWSGARTLRASAWPCAAPVVAAGVYGCVLGRRGALGCHGSARTVAATGIGPAASWPSGPSSRYRDLDREVAQAKAAGRP